MSPKSESLQFWLNIYMNVGSGKMRGTGGGQES